MADRFYFDGQWMDSVTLTDTEAQHLAKVLRKKVGDEVELFDGRGVSARAVVRGISKRDVDLELIVAPERKQRQLPSVVLAVAPPKGDRFRWLIEKATEVGVSRIIPIQTARSVVNPRDTKLDKLRQTMISACKQSRRDSFMEIEPLGAFSSLRDVCRRSSRIFYGDVPDAGSSSANSPNVYGDGEVVAVVGPEGGLTADEIATLVSWGGEPICVAPFTLRVETAAIVISSQLISHFLHQS